jgi:prolyl oligopeptidase
MKFFLLPLVVVSQLGFSQAVGIHYPKTRMENLYETRFGAMIQDPFRWMENTHDPDLYTWLDKEEALTERTLSGALSDQLREEFTAIFAPQGFLRDSIQTEEADGEVKNFFRNIELTKRANLFRNVSDSGRYTIELRKDTGSDLGLMAIFDTQEQKLVSDVVFAKSLNFVWDAGEKSFVYVTTRDGRTQGATAVIRRHFLGRPQAEDQIIYQPHEQSIWLEFEEFDGQFLVMQSARNSTDLGVVDLKSGDISWKFRGNANLSSFGLKAGNLFLISDDRNPMGEILSLNLATGKSTTVIAAHDHPVNSAIQDGDDIFVTYIKDGTETELFVYKAGVGTGTQIKLPGPGSLTMVPGASGIDFSYASYEAPTSRWVYVPETSSLEAVGTTTQSPVELITEKVSYQAHNGKMIPISLIRKRGVVLSPNTPVYLYGYGGFGINMLPAFAYSYIPFLSRGGVVAVVTLPGGNEYGRAWYDDGRLDKKKNVFDDFAAAARRLIHLGYTRPEKLAIGGGSNGGLLVGATANLYPELFRAAVPEVGVLDLTRFQIFTGGAFWIYNYGDMRQSPEFFNQLALSPYHNLVHRQYPATLVTTADQDDRVVPSHSYKYLARLQTVQSPNRLALLHVRKGGSHSSRTGSTAEIIKLQVRKWAFIMKELGM